MRKEMEMLKRPDKWSCIECGTPFRSDMFHYYEGRIENGPAYWSDRGILCSAQCSLLHYRKRKADGSWSETLAAEPFEPGRMARDIFGE